MQECLSIITDLNVVGCILFSNNDSLGSIPWDTYMGKLWHFIMILVMLDIKDIESHW